MDPRIERELMLTRRQFFGKAGCGIGTAALASLLNSHLTAGGIQEPRGAAGTVLPTGGLSSFPSHAPKAKRVIYLFQAGAPAQIEMFDYKPKLKEFHGQELPDSVRRGQRLTGMTSIQKSIPLTASKFKFARYGQSGAEISELLPYTAQAADDITIIRSVYTEAINHDPGVTFIQTGSQLPGRPSMGAWVSYGLGSENANLPAFIVMISQGSAKRPMQPLTTRLWGPGFLPSTHQAVKFRGSGDPVLYLSNPNGIDAASRRQMLDSLAELNQMQLEATGDPEIQTRIAQYEMAYRMQTSVPELTDLSDEPEWVLDMYGPDVRKPGTYASNCLLSRRLAERGVRFIQLYHRGWDQHYNLPSDLTYQCKDVDQASAALVKDLKMRGMLDDTLVLFGGEFGRTAYCQGDLTADNYGRDHHPRCFSMWATGGGIQPGRTIGRTDDFSYNIEEDPIHVHDFQATVLHCLGVDHTKLTYKYQGRHFRLTDVHGQVVQKLLV